MYVGQLEGPRNDAFKERMGGKEGDQDGVLFTDVPACMSWGG